MQCEHTKATFLEPVLPSRAKGLLVYLPHGDEGHVITAASGPGDVVRCCSSPDQLLALIETHIGPIIWDLGAAEPRRLFDHLERRHLIRGSTALLLRLGSQCLRQDTLIAVSQRAPYARLSLRGADDLLIEARMILTASSEINPQLVILNRIRGVVAAAVCHVVTAAAIVGARRVSVLLLARICQIPVRTMEWQLASAGRMTARQLLRWMVTLHAVWNIERRHAPLKAVALAMNFRTSAALFNHLTRHLGPAPTRVCRTLGFFGVLERFIEEYRRCVLHAAAGKHLRVTAKTCAS